MFHKVPQSGIAERNSILKIIVEWIMAIILIVFGLAIGSFIAAYTYRYENEISVTKGRSFCPKCKKQIAWHDNIPLLSYLLLKGKCRNCGKKISCRYPVIETSNMLLYVSVYLLYPRIVSNIFWLGELPYFAGLSLLLIIASLMLAVIVTDIEEQIIPDEVVFLGLVLTFFGLIVGNYGMIYANLLSGFSASLFLLLVFLATRGRGMGLGDVKLAVFVGVFLGAKATLVWMFLSFIVGAGVGLVLLASGKVKFGKHIAFGPFLVVSFFLTLIYKNILLAILFPYIL